MDEEECLDNMGDIANHEKCEKFIEEFSDEIVENFKKHYGLTSDLHMEVDDGNFDVYIADGEIFRSKETFFHPDWDEEDMIEALEDWADVASCDEAQERLEDAGIIE